MKPLIVANWKCSPTNREQARELFDSVKEGVKRTKRVEVVVCPPFVYLSELKGITLGAQNCYWEEQGAFTGEISPLMLKDLGCKYVIIGHSERRKYFNETDEEINKKVKAVLKTGLKSIFCIGETQEQREKGETQKVLERQISIGLKNISDSDLVIAYEPVWAIGTGNPCNVEDAQKALSFIKKLVPESPVLYGGSVNSENASDYIKKAGFQGLLVGGASLKANEFIKIAEGAGN